MFKLMLIVLVLAVTGCGASRDAVVSKPRVQQSLSAGVARAAALAYLVPHGRLSAAERRGLTCGPVPGSRAMLCAIDIPGAICTVLSVWRDDRGQLGFGPPSRAGLPSTGRLDHQLFGAASRTVGRSYFGTCK